MLKEHGSRDWKSTGANTENALEQKLIELEHNLKERRSRILGSTEAEVKTVMEQM